MRMHKHGLKANAFISYFFASIVLFPLPISHKPSKSLSEKGVPLCIKTNRLSMRTILIDNVACCCGLKLSTAFCNSPNINLSSSVYMPEESNSKAFAVAVACDGREYSVVRE